ncbi:hypothetical protein F8M41_020542 [Gigaspora margarita]|uniref:Uncharacterized protein n=1 Tax=Gigaspora margarita TaxID=4874 RepID=A0A8H4AI92_GIGMA|nr:hypothetical protein F8M41_020542 [Gigaspora margarita]
MCNLAETDGIDCKIHGNQQKEMKVENDEIGDNREKEKVYFAWLEGFEYDHKGGETDFDSSEGPELNDDEIVSASKLEKSCQNVLLKEVSTECDTLVQKLAPGEKKPTQETRSEINIKKSTEKNYKETMNNIKNKGKVEEPTKETFDRIYEAGYKVKKNKDKEVKVGTGLSMTYPKFARMDYADGIKDLEEC